MKILLANPETSRSKYDYAGIIDDEPYELECLSAYLLDKGIETVIWDGQMDKNFWGIFRRENPDYVYFCGRTRQENFIKEYCGVCKSGNKSSVKEVVTIVGGIHAQCCPHRFFTDDVDYVVTTFDPKAVYDIIEGNTDSWGSSVPGYIPGNGSNPETINGEEYWHGKVSPSLPFDIKKMPRADRSNFYKYGARYCYLELRPCAIIRTAFCCPYSCSFCYRNRLNCGKYTSRDIADVVDEIESIDCENIYIIDDDFLVGTERLEKFVSLIKAKNIRKKFVCFGRADFIVKHPDIIKELAEIGFYYILTGLEYIENRRLSDTNKRSGVNTNDRAIKILHDSGIHMMGMFITDLDFKKKDFKNLYRWIKHFKLKHVAVSIYTPEMCLENFEEYRDRLVTEDPSEWDYLHVVAKPTHLSVKKYYFYYHLLLIKLFLRAKRQGIYDFMDYKAFIMSFVKNLFRFGG